MVYGIDGTPEIKALIGRNQMIVGTVAQSPIKMGQIAVENMYNILNGKKIAKKYNNTYFADKQRKFI